MSRSKYLRDFVSTSFNMRRELHEEWSRRVPVHGQRTLILNLMVKLFLEGKINVSMNIDTHPQLP